MQAVSRSPTPSMFGDSSDEFTRSAGNFERDFIAKLKIDEHKNEEEYKNEEEHNEGEVEEESEHGEEDEEFSFMLVNSDGSPISADDAFDNGQIRPLFPIFNQDLLFSDDYDGGVHPPINLFVEHPEDSLSPSMSPSTGKLVESPPPEGSYCEWNPKAAVKSNSTGFSKLWRFRDVKLRSNSDGKDTFVFLNHAPAAKPAEKARGVMVKKVEVKKGKTTSSSAHEKHYVMNRARKESDKRKSYLPYRQDLFGFFSTSHGLSRNVHPY
ncbi:hypothetical protein PHAVU_002G071000 [Phaseolus vulgaris]|uniref:Uncharacterized protein n=1 Tax=Phaseolus vulgaris TaxID=3885 RepID=V7CGX4_PHAVU|nr:hypothetical protein PHAVU_002G071000g [Phaseolus vulgaris]ESW29442.1 hypothetical protein PHAVU_002G071000g [Phaseolus vulgaris]